MSESSLKPGLTVLWNLECKFLKISTVDKIQACSIELSQKEWVEFMVCKILHISSKHEHTVCSRYPNQYNKKRM